MIVSFWDGLFSGAKMLVSGSVAYRARDVGLTHHGGETSRFMSSPRCSKQATETLETVEMTAKVTHKETIASWWFQPS